MQYELDLKTVTAHVHQALRAWHQTGGTPENFLSYLLLVQEANTKRPAQIDEES